MRTETLDQMNSRLTDVCIRADARRFCAAPARTQAPRNAGPRASSDPITVMGITLLLILGIVLVIA